MGGSDMRKIFTAALCAMMSMASAAALAAEKWDMPMAYADGNFHTQNGKAFADAVTKASGGKLEIVVHGGGSLFKGGEIKRAVQTGQAPIGERLMSALANENPLFGVDAVPFLATDFGSALAQTSVWPMLKNTMVSMPIGSSTSIGASMSWRTPSGCGRRSVTCSGRMPKIISLSTWGA